MNKKLPNLFVPSIIVTFEIFTIVFNLVDTVVPIIFKHHFSGVRLSIGLLAIVLIGLASIVYVKGLLKDVSEQFQIERKVVAWLLFKKVLVWLIALAIFFGLGIFGGMIHENVSNLTK